MKGIILILVALIGFTNAAVAQPSMEEIVKKWDERRAASKCVKYEVDEVVTMYNRESPRPGVAAQTALHYPGVRYELKSRRTYVFDSETGRYRRDTDGETWGLLSSKVEPYKGATVYDGKKLKSVKWPNEGETSVGKDAARASDFAEMTGDLSSQAFPYEVMPFVFDLGIVPLLPPGVLGPNTFASLRTADYADVAVLDKAGGNLRDSIRFDLAPSGKSADCNGLIEVGRNGEHPVFRYQIEYAKTRHKYELTIRHEKHPTGRLSCKGWTLLASRAGTVEKKVEVRVTSLTPNYLPPAEEFDLTPRKGMVVNKLEIPDTGSARPENPINDRYKVADDGSLVSLPDEAKSRSRPLAVWLVLGCVFLTTLAVGRFLALRDTRRKP